MMPNPATYWRDVEIIMRRTVRQLRSRSREWMDCTKRTKHRRCEFQSAWAMLEELRAA